MGKEIVEQVVEEVVQAPEAKPMLLKLTLVVQAGPEFTDHFEASMKYMSDEFKGVANLVFVDVKSFDVESVG